MQANHDIEGMSPYGQSVIAESSSAFNESSPEQRTNTPETDARPKAMLSPAANPLMSGTPSLGAPSALLTHSQSAPAEPIVTSTPQAADDADLIEEEWVHKVKQILVKTKGDPFRQTQAVAQLRSDYLKKRYNKEVKLSEG